MDHSLLAWAPKWLPPAHPQKMPSLLEPGNISLFCPRAVGKSAWWFTALPVNLQEHRNPEVTTTLPLYPCCEVGQGEDEKSTRGNLGRGLREAVLKEQRGAEVPTASNWKMEHGRGRFTLFSAILDLLKGQRFWCVPQTPRSDPPHRPVTAGRVMGTRDTRGARQHAQPCQTRKPVPLPIIRLVMKLLRAWENPKRRFLFFPRQARFLHGIWAPGQHSTWAPIWDLGSLCQEIQKYRQHIKAAFCRAPTLGISLFCEPQAVPETHGRVQKPCEICQYQS